MQIFTMKLEHHTLQLYTMQIENSKLNLIVPFLSKIFQY